MTHEKSAPTVSPNPAAALDSAPPSTHPRRLLLRLLSLAVTAGLLSWALWYGLEGRWYESTDDAYVQGNVVQITSQVPGTVVSIGADDGDLVQAGSVLVKLDPSDAQVALAGAKANLADAVRRVRGLYSTVSGAAADVAARQVAVTKAQADFNRRRELAVSGAISAEELSHAGDTLSTAQNILSTARHQYETSNALVDDTVLASHPEVMAAAAKVRSAYLDEVRTTLVAPVTGYVAKRVVQVGQRAQPGAALMAVVPLRHVWVDANFRETQLNHMRIGQGVEVLADVYGAKVRYTGEVQSLGVGTGSAFSFLPAQNASGNWIKIVQRIPVRIRLTDPGQLEAHPLRIGLSMQAAVDVHRQDGAMLAQQAPAQPPFSTDVYQAQLAMADALIEQIIHANNKVGGIAKP